MLQDGVVYNKTEKLGIEYSSKGNGHWIVFDNLQRIECKDLNSAARIIYDRSYGHPYTLDREEAKERFVATIVGKVFGLQVVP